MRHETSLVGDDVQFGEGSAVGPFCVVGVDGPAGAVTRIGDRAVMRGHVTIYRGTSIGDDFHAGHGVLVREETQIGHRVSLGSGSVVEHHVRLANDVRLHTGCFVPEWSVLEEGAWLGPRVVVTNARYPNRPDTKDRLEGVAIGARAVIGAAAVLLPGIRVGEDALVGAGAVVVRDVEPGATVVGNPARRIR